MAKHVRTEIIVNERFKIVHVDALNWQVFEFKTLKKSNNPNLASREGESDWVALPAFFGLPEHAFEWIARKHFADGGEIYESLEEAAKAFKASNKKLVREFTKALEESK
ncbi:MAG: hypothetical protein IKE23_12460 [Exiguobacterium sp.]|nr:hypothetical protein [Exiguobacterium sp.]